MKNEKFKIKLFLVCLLPLSLLLVFICSKSPYWVERLYSSGINRYTREGLSLTFGIVPFSIGEIIILILLIVFIGYLLISIYKIFSGTNKKRTIFNFVTNISAVICTIYFAFILVWGLNYYRPTFSKLVNLNIHPASIKELKGLCLELIDETNILRQQVSEDKNGFMCIDGGKKSALYKVPAAYTMVSKAYPILSGSYGKPKGVLLSKAMSYAGISGVYFPFTGEPNVNIDIPSSLIPSTACHEAAHQHGFAREDEANYIAYLVCKNSSFIDFEYSGKLLALIYSMDALYMHSLKDYNSLQTKYSTGVRKDLKEIDQYWQAYEGPIEKISTRINNAYLKSNQQQNGVYSYGQMVDLLLAEYRKVHEQ